MKVDLHQYDREPRIPHIKGSKSLASKMKANVTNIKGVVSSSSEPRLQLHTKCTLGFKTT